MSYYLVYGVLNLWISKKRLRVCFVGFVVDFVLYIYFCVVFCVGGLYGSFCCVCSCW